MNDRLWATTMNAQQDYSFETVDGVEVQHMPDGYVVYQADRDKVHYLNPVAAMVYELCDADKSMSKISAYLQSAFSLDQPPDQEVEDCIANLLNEGLIKKCAK